MPRAVRMLERILLDLSRVMMVVFFECLFLLDDAKLMRAWARKWLGPVNVAQKDKKSSPGRHGR